MGVMSLPPTEEEREAKIFYVLGEQNTVYSRKPTLFELLGYANRLIVDEALFSEKELWVRLDSLEKKEMIVSQQENEKIVYCVRNLMILHPKL